MNRFCFDLQLFNETIVVNIKAAVERIKFDLQRFALSDLTPSDGEYLIQSADDVSTFKALDASARAGQTFRITANLDVSSLFTLTGVKTTEGIIIKDGVVTVNASNLVDNPTAGSTKVELSGEGYTLALADDAPKAVDEPEYIVIELAKGTPTIEKDGYYKFAADYTGTLTIASTAKNVKLIGAGSQLSNVSINASAVTGANLWIENLDINSNQNASLIKFGAGTNYLTVKGTNTLVNTRQ
ncbi:MAG: hypothetical protein IJU71_00495 [Selenomonadaceae bacterium]|nr:hypothetical protein [Selenomonadaceae bacterium]